MKSIIVALISFGFVHAHALDASCERYIQRNASELIQKAENHRELLMWETVRIFDTQSGIELQDRIQDTGRLSLAIKKVRDGKRLNQSDAVLLNDLCRANGRIAI